MDTLKEKYKRAREYEAIVKLEGFKRLRRVKVELANKIGGECVQNGLKPNLELEEAKLEVRGVLRLLDEIEREANRKDKYGEKLKSLGVVI